MSSSIKRISSMVMSSPTAYRTSAPLQGTHSSYIHPCNRPLFLPSGFNQAVGTNSTHPWRENVQTTLKRVTIVMNQDTHSSQCKSRFNTRAGHSKNNVPILRGTHEIYHCLVIAYFHRICRQRKAHISGKPSARASLNQNSCG